MPRKGFLTVILGSRLRAVNAVESKRDVQGHFEPEVQYPFRGITVYQARECKPVVELAAHLGGYAGLAPETLTPPIIAALRF